MSTKSKRKRLKLRLEAAKRMNADRQGWSFPFLKKLCDFAENSIREKGKSVGDVFTKIENSPIKRKKSQSQSAIKKRKSIAQTATDFDASSCSSSSSVSLASTTDRLVSRRVSEIRKMVAGLSDATSR
jgi:hypothetical protein